MFALTSGFLFTSIALILNSTNTIPDYKIGKISQRLDLNKIETINFIESLKQTLFYDIVFQFLITIVCILCITILKGVTGGIFVLILIIIMG